jgi:hypothetical protein
MEPRLQGSKDELCDGCDEPPISIITAEYLPVSHRIIPTGEMVWDLPLTPFGFLTPDSSVCELLSV